MATLSKKHKNHYFSESVKTLVHEESNRCEKYDLQNHFLTNFKEVIAKKSSFLYFPQFEIFAQRTF